MNIKLFALSIAFAALAGIFASCQHLDYPSHGTDDPDYDIDVQMIKISKDSLSVLKGQKYLLKAAVYPSDATNRKIVWSSLNAGIASVDEDGLIVGINDGVTSVIAASPEGCAATCIVTVISNYPVESVTVSPAEAEVYLGSTIELKAIVSPENASVKDVSWKSDNEAVANVDDKGIVTPVSEGVANIIATSKDGAFKGSCRLTVKRVAVTGVTLSSAAISIPRGESFKLEAMIEPENATIREVTWSSDNTAVAIVDQDGSVTGVAEGSANVTASTSDGGFTASCAVTVTKSTGPVPFTLTFDFSCSALPGWPTATHAHVDGGETHTYPLDGVDYTFVIADCDGAAQCTAYWISGEYFVFNDKYRYFGVPALPGYKLVKLSAKHATATHDRTMAVAKQIESLKTHPDDNGGHGYVKGGEPVAVPPQGEYLTFNLEETEANTMYYLYMYKSGFGFSELVLTYHSVE